MIDFYFINTSDQKEEVRRCIAMLYSTPAGTVALDRDLGLDWNVLDLPIEQAKGRLTIEIIEKTRRYEPRVEVMKIQWTQNSEGKLKGKVALQLV